MDEEENLEELNLHEQLMLRAKKVMKVTLAALIGHFRGPAMAHLTDAQKDLAFDMICLLYTSPSPRD